MNNKKRLKKYLILSLMTLELCNLKYETQNNEFVTTVQAKEKTTPDSKVKKFIKKECDEIKELASKENLNKISKKFKKLINFVNGNASIKGVTFSELKNSTKEQIKESLINIDLYIDKKVPNYKNKLSKKYSSIKKFIKKEKKKIKGKIKEEVGEETYNDFKDSKDNLVDTFKYDFDIAKDIINDQIQKIKKR